MDTNTHRLNTSKKLKFKNRMGIKLAALALALGIGTFSLVSKTNDTLTLGVTKDISGDNYKDAIPLFSDVNGKILLSTIDKNKLIIAQDNIETYSHPKRLHLISVINDDNMVITGYTYKKYIDQFTEISKENASFLYKVTSKKGVVLRKTPEISDNKLTSIPENSILIGAKSNADEYNWTNVIYFNGSTIKSGFTSGKFLEQISNVHEHLNDVDTKNFNENDLYYDEENTTNGGIIFFGKRNNKQDISSINNIDSFYLPENNEFGIDISGIDPKVLDKLLKGEIKIPDIIEKKSGRKTNISQFDKKIKFVYIRAEGTNPFTKNLKTRFNNPYIELANVCERNNIPFGFYCRSTCINQKEAELEHQFFSNALKKVKNNYSYHLLPLVIDIELAGDNDRHYGQSINEVTKAKIQLTNMLEKDFGKTILYVSRNAYNDKLESRFLDLELYQNSIHSGRSDIWHVTPIDSNLHQESLKTVHEQVTTNQIALDVKVDNTNNNLIDINLMNKEAFNHYINGKYISQNRKAKSTPTNRSRYLAQTDEYER